MEGIIERRQGREGIGEEGEPKGWMEMSWRNEKKQEWQLSEKATGEGRT